MLIDGKALADELKEEIKKRGEGTPQKKVLFVSFGSDPASKSFLKMKMNMAQSLRVDALLEEMVVKDTKEAIARVEEACQKDFDGVVVQLPIPLALQTDAILDVLPARVDIDILGASAREVFLKRKTERMPPVVRAIHKILEKYKVSFDRKNIVVLGKGRLVGGPIADYLSKLGVPYMAVDISVPEEDRREMIRSADMIITGIGSPHYIKPDMVKPGVILIDAGTSEAEGKLSGDADPAVSEVASLMTPVPGGVGPITVAALFYNLFVD